MKIIDVLNKIANGEEVPEKIKYDTKEMKYDHNKQDYLGYYSNGNGEWLFQYLFDRCRNTEHFINDEVEIIEEDKKIEKIDIGDKVLGFDDSKQDIYIGKTPENEAFAIKINEIIEVLNERDIQRH